MNFEPTNNINQTLTQTNLNPINTFHLKHQTTILIILFTNLKNSTKLTKKKNKSYAQSIHQKHNQILQKIIIYNKTNTYIKNINNTLICIFSKPTTTIKQTIQIQKTLTKYNTAHPNKPPIIVHINIHIKQISIKNKTNINIFGHHINQTTQIKSLTDNKQILITHPVHDSASGWLIERGYQ